MPADDNTLVNAIQFLIDGKEKSAADLLRTCTIENSEYIDSWMDGSVQLDGLLIEVGCPRATYEVLSNHSDSRTKSIQKALQAVLPSGSYLKTLRVRAIPSKRQLLSDSEMRELISRVEAQKAVMIAVATGGPRIQDVNKEYTERRHQIKQPLDKLGFDDPNPFHDLWAWYGKWSDGSHLHINPEGHTSLNFTNLS